MWLSSPSFAVNLVVKMNIDIHEGCEIIFLYDNNRFSLSDSMPIRNAEKGSKLTNENGMPKFHPLFKLYTNVLTGPFVILKNASG